MATSKRKKKNLLPIIIPISLLVIAAIIILIVVLTHHKKGGDEPPPPPPPQQGFWGPGVVNNINYHIPISKGNATVTEYNATNPGGGNIWNKWYG